MPGLLETPNQTPEQSAETIPEGEVSAQAKPVLDSAIELLYDENFENFVQMFQQHGEQGFPDAMSLAINGTLERLEKDQGELPVEILAEVGTKLIEMLLQDLIQNEVVKNVTKEMMMGAVQKTLADWGQENPDRFDEQEMAQAAQQASQGITPETPQETPQAPQQGVLPQGGA